MSAKAQYFSLSSEPASFEPHRLLSVTGAVVGEKITVTLKVELTGWDIEHTLQALHAIKRAHDATAAGRAKAKKRVIARATGAGEGAK